MITHTPGIGHIDGSHDDFTPDTSVKRSDTITVWLFVVLMLMLTIMNSVLWWCKANLNYGELG